MAEVEETTTKRKRRVSLTPEEKLLKKCRARRLFKALIRMIFMNYYWLKDIEDDEMGDNVLINVQILTKKKGKKSLLTLREKALLHKPKNDRTESEKMHLNRVVGGFKCFRRYPANVKYQLAAVTYFRYFQPGRVIVKQNDEPFAMYFILEGDVLVTQCYYDKLLKEYVNVELGTMVTGSMFGEVSLLHGIPRTATITTITDCEMLEIKKEDFDIVLKATVLQEWNEIQRCMSYFNYFSEWDEVTVREACILGKKRSFEPNETILGDGCGVDNHTYFIVAGVCDVIETLRLKVYYKKGVKKYKLYKTPIDVTLKKKQQLPHDVEQHFIRVCVLNRLACFNLGEEFVNRRIVASVYTECLLIPTYWLFQKNKANIWNRVQQYLNQRIPNTESIFKNFLDNRKWVKYKNQLAKEIRMEKKRVTNNSIHNVPYSIRIRESIPNEK